LRATLPYTTLFRSLADGLRGAPHRLEDDEVDVDGGEHELHGQQHQHGVAPDEEPVDAQGEQGGGEDEELTGDHTDLLDSSSRGVRSRRAMAMPPTNAARRMNPTTSKGTTNRPMKARAREAVSVAVPISTSSALPK